jgi:hypothetical protein
VSHNLVAMETTISRLYVSEVYTEVEETVEHQAHDTTVSSLCGTS